MELLEGLVTNLFLVREGKVYTAGSNVLPGYFRETVLQACRELGIHVNSNRAVRLSELDHFDGAFLSGTGKVITSVRDIEYVSQHQNMAEIGKASLAKKQPFLRYATDDDDEHFYFEKKDLTGDYGREQTENSASELISKITAKVDEITRRTAVELLLPFQN